MLKKIGFFGALILGLIILFNLSSSLPDLISKSKKVEKEKEKLEALQRENEKLRTEIEQKKNQEFVEKEAREKLGFTKEGETLIVIPKEEPQKKESKPQEESNWRKWTNLLFGS